MIKAAQRLAELRLLVGFLGEQAPAWWPSKFFSATAPSFLAPVFARTMPQAQYHGVTTAAARLHDERIGVGRTFHLFRVPEVYEQSADAAFQDKTFTDQVFAHLKDRDHALARLASLADAGAKAKASEGPVLAGDWQEDLEPALALLAGIYKEAFSKGIQAFPYLRERQ